MADSSRIDDLRRRVQKDPASIAFAQLAEELRRAGELKEAVEVSRTGLNRHPGYVSARVTLGRALIELNDLDNADAELRLVLKNAPDNLSALRGRADILRRRGDHEGALAQYRVALGIAPNDPELERWVAELSKEVGVDLRLPRPETKPTPVKVAPAKATAAKPTPAKVITGPKPDPARERALRAIAALERFLDAVHVVRAQQHA